MAFPRRNKLKAAYLLTKIISTRFVRKATAMRNLHFVKCNNRSSDFAESTNQQKWKVSETSQKQKKDKNADD